MKTMELHELATSLRGTEFDLINFDKTYKDVYGRNIPFMDLYDLMHSKVKSFYFNIVTKEATITLLTD